MSWSEIYHFYLSIAQAGSSNWQLKMSRGVVTRGHLTQFKGKLNSLLF
jgi:hypothetical protein